MSIKTIFDRFKHVVGGVRSDSPAATEDGDSIALRVNEYGEVLVVAGSGQSGSETLLNVSNVSTLGGDVTYTSYVDMRQAKYFTLEAIISAPVDPVAVTLAGTTWDDGTAYGSCTYVDITNDLFGVVEITTTDIYICDTPVELSWLRVTTIFTNNGGNTSDCRLDIRKGA